jgi:hypothetical protein
MSDLPQVPAPRCIHLCSKALMVHGESFADDPAYQAGFDHAWCGLTGRPLGPDDDDVAWDRCSDPARGCYKEF